MFESDFKETHENRCIIPDFSYGVVNGAVRLLYYHEVVAYFKQMLSLLQFADKYGIPVIKELAETSLIERISQTNVCRLLNYAKMVNASKLLQKCVEFIVHCSNEKKDIPDLSFFSFDIVDKNFQCQILKKTFQQNYSLKIVKNSNNTVYSGLYKNYDVLLMGETEAFRDPTKAYPYAQTIEASEANEYVIEIKGSVPSNLWPTLTKNVPGHVINGTNGATVDILFDTLSQNLFPEFKRM